MNLKAIILFLFSTLIVACTRVDALPDSDIPEEVNALVITATPVQFDSRDYDFTDKIDTLFYEEYSFCDEVEHLDFSRENRPIVFHDLTNQIDISSLEIQELADNVDGNYRAYVSSLYFCELKNPDCRKNVIYWQDKPNNQFYQIEWIQKDLYLYRSVLWLGKNILVVREAAFPGMYSVVGIDVESKEFVYYGVVKNCK
jgi:hypothetical protein